MVGIYVGRSFVFTKRGRCERRSRSDVASGVSEWWACGGGSLTLVGVEPDGAV